MYKLPELQEIHSTERQKKYFRDEMAKKAYAAGFQRAETNYRYPKNADEWWNIVNTYWDDLILVVQKYVRLEEMCTLEGNISPFNLLENAILAKKYKANSLSQLFSRAWVQAPDNGNIHGDMAWGILCDLCSESYVLYPDGPE